MYEWVMSWFSVCTLLKQLAFSPLHGVTFLQVETELRNQRHKHSNQVQMYV